MTKKVRSYRTEAKALLFDLKKWWEHLDDEKLIVYIEKEELTLNH